MDELTKNASASTRGFLGTVAPSVALALAAEALKPE